MKNDRFDRAASRLTRTGVNAAVKGIMRFKGEDLEQLRRALENIAQRAAWLAVYADTRSGCGCNDQGHASAVKAANKTSKLVWCKGFGYNGHFDVRPDDPNAPKRRRPFMDGEID